LSELQHGAQPLSRDEFLSRVAATKERIARLASDIQSIANIHQRMLWSPNARFAELEGILEETQKTNTSIKDDIKVLEYDALREPDDRVKKPQVESLKRSFKTQLDAFQKEESDYAQRCRDAIGRQYQIINPEATEAEISEVADADWGDEGIFSQAVSVLCRYSGTVGDYTD
jgi:syntaxin 1B/2/3